jgi:DNA repair protein RadC
VNRRAAPAGLDDAGFLPPAAPVAEEKPHYLGHRQRLRERLIEAGAAALPDYELLEFLLTAALPRGDVKPLAKKLIAHFHGFAGVLAADRNALAAVPGVGDAIIAQLMAAREAGLRLARAELRERPVLGSRQKVIDYCTAQIGFAAIEEFHLLFLDRKNALIADERQQRGTVDHTPVYPREVVKRAIELGASALIMAHNHHGLKHPVVPASAGLPVPGFRIAVLDEQHRELPPGRPGILAIDRQRSPLFWFPGY